jgi:hypothetical protein
VAEDLALLAELYEGRTLILLEAGYPSGELCGGSEERQAEFIRQIFSAWDRHADQLELVSFTWPTDLPESAVTSFQEYYGVATPCFAEMLGSLGLRRRAGSGRDKPAFRELKAQAARHGWPSR